jgi:predicted DNA-binding transcriptional regulator
MTLFSKKKEKVLKAKLDTHLVITEMFDIIERMSIRSLKKWTGLSHRQVKKVIYIMVKNGQLRRVHPSEVGSNIYVYREPPQDLKDKRETVIKKYAKVKKNVKKTLKNGKKFEVYTRV